MKAIRTWFLFFFFFFVFFDFMTNKQHKCSLATAKTQHQVEGGLLLDVVVGKSTTILQLLASEDKTLLVGRNSFLVLNLGLHVVDGVRGLNFKSDGLASEGLDENLHATAETEDEVKGRLLLDVVVREGATVLELLASEDQALLIRGNSLLVLNLRLYIVDGIRGFDFEGNSLAGEGLDDCFRC